MTDELKDLADDFGGGREKQTEKILTNAAEFIHDGQVDNISDLVKELHNALFFITTKHTKIQTCGGQNVRRT